MNSRWFVLTVVIGLEIAVGCGEHRRNVSDASGNIDSFHSNEYTALVPVALQETNPSGKGHPLLPPLKLANEINDLIRKNIRDYTCVMTKREMIKGQLNGREIIFAKVRHEQVKDGQVVAPFSVYLNYKAPKKVQNREVFYVQGTNDDNLFFRKGGTRLAFITGFSKPDSFFAMRENRYPITEFGILRLVERMIDIGNKEMAHEECIVVIKDGVRFKEHTCKLIEIEHPVQREHFEFNLARLFIDTESQIPIRFESYLWPKEGSDTPVLKEEYTYSDLKLNVGLVDDDFKFGNPDDGDPLQTQDVPTVND